MKAFPKSGKLKMNLKKIKIKCFPMAGKWRFNYYIVIWFYFIKMDSISSILKMKLFPMAGKNILIMLFPMVEI